MNDTQPTEFGHPNGKKNVWNQSTEYGHPFDAYGVILGAYGASYRPLKSGKYLTE